jgi:hypothetical protein
MHIPMAGINHTRTAMQQRERFAFSSGDLEAALKWIARAYPHLGCVISASCNRTELYLSGKREEDPGPEPVLLPLKAPSFPDSSGELPSGLWVCRQGMEAVEPLFLLTGGLQSPIVGEQQILAQVKGALEGAQKAKSTDPAPERLFQRALGGAKRVHAYGDEQPLSLIWPSLFGDWKRGNPPAGRGTRGQGRLSAYGNPPPSPARGNPGASELPRHRLQSAVCVLTGLYRLHKRHHEPSLYPYR